jgi:hypothetical protein
VELPSASTTSRLDRPWVYSWYTIPASSPELPGMSGPSCVNRYICMVGGVPSGGVFMLALLTWLGSGRPSAVLAPSSAWPCTASPSTASKLPALRVKPIGPAFRWSWKVPRKYIIWTAFCSRLTRHELATAGFQEHLNAAEQRPPTWALKSVNG